MIVLGISWRSPTRLNELAERASDDVKADDRLGELGADGVKADVSNKGEEVFNLGLARGASFSSSALSVLALFFCLDEIGFVFSPSQGKGMGSAIQEASPSAFRFLVGWSAFSRSCSCSGLR